METVKQTAERLVLASLHRLEISKARSAQAEACLRSSRQAVTKSEAVMQDSVRLLRGIHERREKTVSVPQAAIVVKAAPPDLIEVIASREFANEVVVMDGRHFIDCTLSNCVLEYSGYPTVLETTQFQGCSFRFKAEAALTMRFCECFELIASSCSDYTTVFSQHLGKRQPN